MNNDNQKPTVWNKTFVLLLVINGIQSLGFQIYTPILPVYALRFTSSETIIGVLGASIAVAALATRPYAAYLTDRGNRKRVIVIALAVMAVSGFGPLLASSVFQLILIRLLQGFLFSILSTTVVASGILSLPESKLGYGLGILSLSNIGCQAVAPALGIYIVNRYGYPNLFIFVILIMAVSWIAAFFLERTPVPEKADGPRKKIELRDMFAVETGNLVFLMLFFTASIGIISNFLLLFGKAAGLSGLGYYFTIFAVVLILIRLIGGGIIDRFYYGAIVIVSAAITIAGLLILANATSFLSIAITAVLMGIGYGYANPSIQAEMVRRVSPDRVGAVTATSYIGMDSAYISAPIIMGVLAENFGYKWGFSSFCLLLIIAIVFILYENRKSPKSIFSKTGR